MARRCCWLLVFAFLLTSCDRAHRYGPVTKEPPKDENPDASKPSYRLAWMEPRTRHDVPIVFIASTDAEWQRLPKFWNASPFGAGMPTVHLGQGPFGAMLSLAMTEQTLVVKIKVPRGLPDPTPLFPPTNPPSLGRWRLGQKLFFERKLQAGADTYSCASCHNPDRGFSDADPRPNGASYNTLSLINVAYNRRQFWDGRVRTLEETVVRSFNDERTVSPDEQRERALKHHVWGGFVTTLVNEKRYEHDFDIVFGLDHPTQDSVAQALATYMRTILAGDSLFDRTAEPKSTADFKAVLDDDSALLLRDQYLKDRPRVEMPELLAKGYEVFKGKARCVQCHNGPLFTDQDYHNVGYPGDEGLPPPGKETGRAAQVPIGLKQARLIGAFRTPSLRNLVKTRPYFHNGALPTLPQVVDFYDAGVQYTPRLAKTLKDGDHEQQLNLTPDERDALVMFLRSLEGTQADPVIQAPP
jgi:cytochrome c peroxidase